MSANVQGGTSTSSGSPPSNELQKFLPNHCPSDFEVLKYITCSAVVNISSIAIRVWPFHNSSERFLYKIMLNFHSCHKCASQTEKQSLHSWHLQDIYTRIHWASQQCAADIQVLSYRSFVPAFQFLIWQSAAEMNISKTHRSKSSCTCHRTKCLHIINATVHTWDDIFEAKHSCSILNHGNSDLGLCIIIRKGFIE